MFLPTNYSAKSSLFCLGGYLKFSPCVMCRFFVPAHYCSLQLACNRLKANKKKWNEPWLNHLVIKTATEKETTAKVVGSCPWLYPVVLLIYYSWWLPFATQYSYCVLRKTHGKQKHPNPFRWKNTYNPSIKSFFSRNYPSISWTVP